MGNLIEERLDHGKHDIRDVVLNWHKRVWVSGRGTAYGPRGDRTNASVLIGRDSVSILPDDYAGDGAPEQTAEARAWGS